MSASIKSIPVELLIEKYNELNNIWKVGEFFGVPGQSVHAKLTEIGAIRTMNYFTDEDADILRSKYQEYKSQGRLQELADELGRTKQFICRKAKELGLTGGVRHYNFSEEKREQLSVSAKQRIKKYGHPKGALGMKHTKESREKMSASSINNWEKHRDEWCDAEHRKIRSDRMAEYQESGKLGVRSRCYLWKVTVGGKEFLAKSSWEYDIALYLESLKERGLIKDWQYEPTIFRFKYNTLGVRTYRPDFSVTRSEMTYYIEVKGWEDKKFVIKKNLMSTEYPDVKIIYIRDKEYRKIEKKYSKVLTHWGEMKEMTGMVVKTCSVDGCNNPVHAKGLCRHHFYLEFGK